MRIVPKEEAINFPGICAFTGDGEGPFLDIDTWLNARDLNGVDPYGYISVAKVIDMGRAVGMVEQEKFDELRADVAAYGEHVRELEELVDALTTIKDAEKVLVNA